MWTWPKSQWQKPQQHLPVCRQLLRRLLNLNRPVAMPSHCRWYLDARVSHSKSKSQDDYVNKYWPLSDRVWDLWRIENVTATPIVCETERRTPCRSSRKSLGRNRGKFCEVMVSTCSHWVVAFQEVKVVEREWEDVELVMPFWTCLNQTGTLQHS